MEKGDRIIVSSKVSIFHYQWCKGVIVGEWGEHRRLRRFDVKLDDGRKVWFDEDEIEKELTEKQQEIFEKAKTAWEERVGKGNVDEEGLKRIIIIADTHNDGLKRISPIGSDKVHLVPMEEERINSLDENEKVLLLKLLMEDIRGNWGFDVVERIELIKALTTSITTLPKGLLNAIRYNAETFDGEFNDGRIFRDGHLELSEEIIEKIGLPKEMKAGVSGNMAKMLGAREVNEGNEYYGTYSEVASFCKLPDEIRGRSELFTELSEYLTFPENRFEDYEGEKG